MNKERLSEKLQSYAKAYKEPPYGREVDGTVEVLEEAAKKLAEYESLENKGLLLRLPCKVGDTFWELNENTEPFYVYPRIAHGLHHCVYVLERLGKTTFLTQFEAEEKLRELEGKENGEIL